MQNVILCFSKKFLPCSLLSLCYIIVKTPTIILLFYNSHIAGMRLKLPEVINQIIFVLYKKTMEE